MNLFVSFAVSLILSLVFTPLVIFLAKKWGFVDDPKKHKHPAVIHKKPVPRAGGLAIYLSVLFASFLFLSFSKQVFGIFIGGLILVVVGLIDDKRDLGKFLKLFLQILAAIVVVLAGVGIAFVTNPLPFLGAGSGMDVIRLDEVKLIFNFFGEHSILLFADLLAILWIVWVINMVNFSTGVDGQMPGIVFTALIVLFIVSLRFGDPEQVIVAKLALIGAGATLGFLAYNFAPAKIFPGDSGSYFLGYLVAVIAILSGAKVGTAFLVMAVPLLDGIFTIARRILMGKSPFAGDRGHLHHKLMELGLTQRQVALFYWILCAILGMIALSLDSAGKLFATAVIIIIVLGGLLWLNMTLPLKDQK